MKVRPAFTKPLPPQLTKKLGESIPVGVAVKGISSSTSIAAENPGFAQLIENGYVSQIGVRPRGGAKLFATTGTRAVQSLLTYRTGQFRKMFAVANGTVYDLSDPISTTTTPPISFSGLASSEYSFVNFGTPGGDFLIAVNGTDAHLIYNGITMVQNVPAITGPVSAPNSSVFSQTWVHSNRIWFIKRDSQSAYYLPVDSIGGAVTEFPLTGVFTRGGTLAYGATWSQDSGAGLGQRCVFVSTAGEAAVYEGFDPASNFVKVGVYEISRPLGKNSFTNIGGELLMVVADGIVPLSQALTKDEAALSLASITRAIAPDWKALVRVNANRPFRFTKWPEKNLGYVSYGGTYSFNGTLDVIDTAATTYVVNLETGAWSTYSGWDIQSAALFNNKMFFGSSNGKVYEAEAGGKDDGAGYLFRYLDWPSGFVVGSDTKLFTQCRSTFTYARAFTPQITMSVDYHVVWPAAPPAAAEGDLYIWDSGNLWDAAVVVPPKDIWDPVIPRTTEHRWRSLGRTGYRGALMSQITINNVATPDVEYISGEVELQRGAVVT